MDSSRRKPNAACTSKLMCTCRSVTRSSLPSNCRAFFSLVTYRRSGMPNSVLSAGTTLALSTFSAPPAKFPVGKSGRALLRETTRANSCEEYLLGVEEWNDGFGAQPMVAPRIKGDGRWHPTVRVSRCSGRNGILPVTKVLYLEGGEAGAHQVSQIVSLWFFASN